MLFANGNKATAAARLQASLERRLKQMVRLNPRRMDYADKLRDLIERYNAGSKNIDEFFEELKKLARSLTHEQERHIRIGLTEEELAVFDLLTKPDPELTNSEETAVKKVVRNLLDKLKRELLVLDWKQRQVTRAAVKVGSKKFSTLVSRTCTTVFCLHERPTTSTHTSSTPTKAWASACTHRPRE